MSGAMASVCGHSLTKVVHLEVGDRGEPLRLGVARRKSRRFLSSVRFDVVHWPGNGHLDYLFA